jgi:hypothetical protein
LLSNGITLPMKKAAKKKADIDETGVLALMRGVFRAFSKLAEQAGEGRPLLRGLRIAHDPKVDRFVVVHSGSRIEFLLVLHGEGRPPFAEIECRRMDSAGVTEAASMARFRFDQSGVVSESSVAELAGERIDQATGAWQIVAAVIWDALQA